MSPAVALILLSGVAQTGQKGFAPAFDLRRGDFRVRVVLRRLSKSEERVSSSWWGGFDKGRNRIVDGVTILYRDRSLLVPRSSYADLANVRSLSARVQREKLLVLLIGGDASTSFRAELIADRTRVLERRVASGENPAGDYETTKYFLRANTKD